MVFIAGEGGGSAGGAPIVADIARTRRAHDRRRDAPVRVEGRKRATRRTSSRSSKAVDN
jgi:hypothetical protein